MMRLTTKGGYPIDECTSALIKVLRRSDEELALFFGLELAERFPEHTWKRLTIFAAEDVGLADPQAIVVVTSLWDAWARIKKLQGKARVVEGDLLVMALLICCRAPKSKEADTAKNWMEERRQRGFKPAVPPYSLNSHTARGKIAGKTDTDWWRDDAWLPPGGYGKYEFYARLKQQGGELPEEPAGGPVSK